MKIEKGETLFHRGDIKRAIYGMLNLQWNHSRNINCLITENLLIFSSAAPNEAVKCSQCHKGEKKVFLLKYWTNEANKIFISYFLHSTLYTFDDKLFISFYKSKKKRFSLSFIYFFLQCKLNKNWFFLLIFTFQPLWTSERLFLLCSSVMKHFLGFSFFFWFLTRFSFRRLMEIYV